MPNAKLRFLNFFRKGLRFRLAETILFLIATSGMHRLVVKIAPGNNLYRPGTIRSAKRKGIRYELDLSDYQHWLIYYSIPYDTPEELYKLISPGDTFIDIGTNIGQTALQCAAITGEKGQVIGFEPDPVNFNIAKNNIALNHFDNILLFNLGLGAKETELKMKVNSPGNRGGNRIDPDNSAGSFSVKITTLDQQVLATKIMRADVIKIDVEGFESEVLKGARNTIVQFRPKLYVEIDDNNLRTQESSAKEVIRFIHELGYRITDSDSKKIIAAEDDFLNSHFDIICMPATE